MDHSYTDILQNILSGLEDLPSIRVEDIPDISLYMDQVTTFMDDRLHSMRRSKDEKIMTKTMVNNYTKNKLLPAPERKKYSRSHMLLLLYIYYFKNVLSLQDIQSVLGPLTERYFQNEELPLDAIYTETFRHLDGRIPHIREDIEKSAALSSLSFQDVPEEDREFLQLFSLITSLTMDVYIKKRVIEQLIDDCLLKE